MLNFGRFTFAILRYHQSRKLVVKNCCTDTAATIEYFELGRDLIVDIGQIKSLQLPFITNNHRG